MGEPAKARYWRRSAPIASKRGAWPASPSGEARPVGTVWGEDGRPREGLQPRRDCVGVPSNGGRPSQRRHRSRRAVAHVAVRMVRKAARGRWLLVVRFGTLMLVGVVPHMHGGGAFFVLAIRRSRSPDGLQRQQHEQKNRKPASHWRALYVARSRLLPTRACCPGIAGRARCTHVCGCDKFPGGLPNPGQRSPSSAAVFPERWRISRPPFAAMPATMLSPQPRST